MTFWTIGLAVYAMTTLVAVVMTYQEQKRRGETSPLHSAIGYLLCTIWPVVAAVMVIFYRPVEQEG